jgi:hypothetical protein
MPVIKKESLRQPWAAFLNELDTLLPHPVEIRCLGAFLLTVIYSLPRVTADLDCLAVLPIEATAAVEELAGRNSRLAKKHRVWVQYVGIGVVDLPDGYEQRLERLDFGFEKLQLSALGAYNLVLSKLTRNSPKDREDVKFVAQQQNLSYTVAYELFVKEMKPWVARADWHEGTLQKVWKEYFPRP